MPPSVFNFSEPPLQKSFNSMPPFNSRARFIYSPLQIRWRNVLGTCAKISSPLQRTDSTFWPGADFNEWKTLASTSSVPWFWAAETLCDAGGNCMSADLRTASKSTTSLTFELDALPEWSGWSDTAATALSPSLVPERLLAPPESRAVPLLFPFPLPDMITRLKTSAFQCRFALEDIRKWRGSHMTIEQKSIMWSRDRLLFQGSSSWYEGLHYSDNSLPIIFYLAVVTSIGAGVIIWNYLNGKIHLSSPE